MCVYRNCPEVCLVTRVTLLILKAFFFYLQSLWQTSCYMWLWYATWRLMWSPCTLNAVLSFCPTTCSLLIPKNSLGCSPDFWTAPQETVSPSGYIDAISRRDKGRDGLRDVFLGACLHHVASASLSNTGGYGQLMGDYYVTSPPPVFPLIFFFKGF